MGQRIAARPAMLPHCHGAGCIASLERGTLRGVLRFDYEPESDILVATCDGDLTVDLLKDSITLQAEHGHWQSALIFDATAAKPAALSGQDISSILAHAEMIAAGRPPRGPVVIVANDDVIYGLARMAQTLSEMRLNSQVDVVRSMAQAREWLAARRRG